MGGGFAPVYPCLMHEVPNRFVPQDVAVVIGRQSGASYIGGALMPLAGGWFAQHAMGVLPYVSIVCVVLLFACVAWLDARTARRGA
jgi:fucose permease